MSEPKTSGETHYNHPAAEECAIISDLLFRTANILHDLKSDRTPLKAYGLEKSTHMKAAAKVLRLISCDLSLRSKALKDGTLK